MGVLQWEYCIGGLETWVFEAWLCCWLWTHVLGQIKPPTAQWCGASTLRRLPTDSVICSEKSDKIIMWRIFRKCRGLSRVKINCYLSSHLTFVHLTSFQKTVLVPHEFLEIEIPIPVNPISVTRDILVTFFWIVRWCMTSKVEDFSHFPRSQRTVAG